MTDNTTNTPNLTPRELEILFAMCKSFKSKPDVDIELFATLARFSTPGSATTNLNKVLKKVKAAGLATPGSARKRKADLLLSVSMTAALTDSLAAKDGDEEDADEATPSKTTKKKKSGSGKGKASAEAEESEDALVKDEKEGSDGADELA